MDLISVEYARTSLSFDDDDPKIPIAIAAASRSVIDYCDSDAFTDTSGLIPTDTSGEAIVPESVKRATVVLAGIFLRDPSGVHQDYFADGFMPPMVRALLNPYRTPVIG